MPNLTYSQKLKILRGKETQEEVSKNIGIRRTTLCMYERGLRVPKDEIKRKLADYFHVTVQTLFYD